MEKSHWGSEREKRNFSFLRCRGSSPIQQPPRWGFSLSLAAALLCAGCAAPTYEQTHDSLSALSSVLGVVATAVPGASAVGLAGHSISAANTLTGAVAPGSSSPSQERTETIYDGAYQVKGYFVYQGETVRVFDRDHRFLGHADATGTYDDTAHKLSPNAVPGLLLGKN